jgi:hypothetical protein
MDIFAVREGLIVDAMVAENPVPPLLGACGEDKKGSELSDTQAHAEFEPLLNGIILSIADSTEESTISAAGYKLPFKGLQKPT